jgi:DNA-binding transcriptional ArsR family regulator
MPAEFSKTSDTTDLERVVSVLDDTACRQILSALGEPMTVSEIADATDLPLSSTYKKLDKLSNAALVRETSGVRGRCQESTYISDFDRIDIDLDDRQELRASVTRSNSFQSGIWFGTDTEF